jgi:hypothetical protein
VDRIEFPSDKSRKTAICFSRFITFAIGFAIRLGDESWGGLLACPLIVRARRGARTRHNSHCGSNECAQIDRLGEGRLRQAGSLPHDISVGRFVSLELQTECGRGGRLGSSQDPRLRSRL